MKCLMLCLAVSGWLSTHGFGEPQRAAVLRNAYLESRFEPCVVRGRRATGSAYLFQWLGPRRRALEAYARVAGCPSWLTQLAFMDLELRAPRYALFWLARTEADAFRQFRLRFERGK